MWRCLIQIDVYSNKLFTCLIYLSLSFDRGKGLSRKESCLEPKNKMRRPEPGQWLQRADSKRGSGESNGERTNWWQWQGGGKGGFATNDSRSSPSSKNRETGEQADLRGAGQVSPWPLFQGQWVKTSPAPLQSLVPSCATCIGDLATTILCSAHNCPNWSYR